MCLALSVLMFQVAHEEPITVCCGAIVTLLGITLKYSSHSFFIVAAIILRFIDGAREALFEVVAFVYFSEGVLEGTTQKM